MGFRYTVRQATPDDCGDILRFIKELAEFEGEQPDQVVKNTEKALQDDGFGDHTFYHCLIVEAVDDEDTDSKRGVTVGYAMHFFAYSSWQGRLVYLEDLYVQPPHRGKGLGKALVGKVAKIGAERGCIGMQWIVQDSNTTARRFYDQLNTTDMTETKGWRLMEAKGERFVKLTSSVAKPESNIHFL